MCQINTDPMVHRQGYLEVVGRYLLQSCMLHGTTVHDREKILDRKRRTYYYVAVPPRISSRDLETDLVVRENDNLTLSCDANGHPKPLVVWRREDGEPITVQGTKG